MRERTDPFPYEDIVNLPHHRSQTHPHMSMEERAAQFSSFAALTGHKEAVQEKARRTSERMELGKTRRRRLEKCCGVDAGAGGRSRVYRISSGSKEKRRGVCKGKRCGKERGCICESYKA